MADSEHITDLLVDIIEELDDLRQHHQDILDNWVGPQRRDNGADRWTIKIRRATYASACDKVRNIIRAHGFETLKIDGEWKAVSTEGQS